MKDIEYERSGIKKKAGECFKEALIAEGWAVIEERKAPKPKAKVKENDDS